MLEDTIKDLTGSERELVEKIYRIVDTDYVRTGKIHHKRILMVLAPIATMLAGQGMDYGTFVNSDLWCGCNEQPIPKE